jgi:hypothetical protein
VALDRESDRRNNVATRQEIIDAVRGFIQRADKIAAGLSAADWETNVYERGWNVKQVYSHLASMGGAIPLFVNMAKNPPPSGGAGVGFNIDAFNAQQVALRQSKSTDEIVAEIRTSFEGSLKSLDSVSDDLLAKEMTTPFGLAGTLGDILVEEFTGRLAMHLDDIERAVRG